MEQQIATMGPNGDAPVAPRALRLYELAPAFEAAMERMLQVDTSTAEGQAEAERLGAEIEALGLALEKKVDGAAAMVANLEGTAKAIGEEIKRLLSRKVHFERQAEHLKLYVFRQMKTAGLTQVDGPRFSAAIRLNNEAVEVVEQKAIPKEFWRIQIVEEVDKKAIHAAHRAGQEVPGVRFTRGERLELR